MITAHTAGSLSLDCLLQLYHESYWRITFSRCRAQAPWVSRGMDERFRRVQEVEGRIQMLLGIFAAHGVIPLEFKPTHNVTDLLVQHLDAIEQEAQEQGGIQQLLAQHFAKVYKVAMPLGSAA
ncbi:MAG TPA: hypothetical protein VF807_07005 [Ktedonobacterales bacterium]